MKTAIVLGATGLIGKSLLQQLAEQAAVEKVVAITRRPVNYPSDKITNQVIDFDNLSQFAHIFRGDMLFSCLGTTKKQAGSIAKQRTVDLDYQLQVAQLAAQNQIKHYFLVSSSGANANSRSPYLQMKGELEQHVKPLHFDTVNIFQPSLLVGHRADTRIAETLGNYLLPTLCKLPWLKKYRPISGQQVAKKMVSVAMAEHKKTQTHALDVLFDC
ncbi:NADH dehydrogenase [Pseudoalteromonas luteoviolacea]|uniref:NADH dehydrogenase n=1 Tax=Pseudoalteromonas luteoviolacea TaxID=43657 RepID=A0A0C1QDV1_9GAMM|nr:NAD(P)H-binding protein [Pseudoalteromonas luteoviolacea]KID58831.1 NADH dehydrogenase [Pseudoalteromonas luteoviolacea]